MSKSDALAQREAGRDAVLQALAGQVPYNRFLGVEFDRLGDELTARLPYKEPLIVNPVLPAIHGGPSCPLVHSRRTDRCPEPIPW